MGAGFSNHPYDRMLEAELNAYLEERYGDDEDKCDEDYAPDEYEDNPGVE